jgi:hypothetical protein
LAAARGGLAWRREQGVRGDASGRAEQGGPGGARLGQEQLEARGTREQGGRKASGGAAGSCSEEEGLDQMGEKNWERKFRAARPEVPEIALFCQIWICAKNCTNLGRKMGRN